jgi:hypothetical protein
MTLTKRELQTAHKEIVDTLEDLFFRAGWHVRMQNYPLPMLDKTEALILALFSIEEKQKTRHFAYPDLIAHRKYERQGRECRETVVVEVSLSLDPRDEAATLLSIPLDSITSPTWYTARLIVSDGYEGEIDGVPIIACQHLEGLVEGKYQVDPQIIQALLAREPWGSIQKMLVSKHRLPGED